MFVDVCIAKNNEKEFIDIADQLGTKKICFIDSKIKRHFSLTSKQNKKDYFLTNVLKPHKKAIFFFEGIDEKKTFHSPSKILNQVFFKEIKNNLFGISFNYLLKKPYEIEKIKFIIKMCQKYKIKLFIASFAKTPNELRSKNHLTAISTLLGMNTKTSQEALINLYNTLK